MHFDGASSLTSLPGQNTWLFEAGLAWWWKGHRRNLKASAGRIRTNGQPDRVQALVQRQVYYY